MEERQKNREETTRIVQRIVGVIITLGLFVFLTLKGQDIPNRLEILMVMGVGSLVVGVETLTDLRPYGKK